MILGESSILVEHCKFSIKTNEVSIEGEHYVVVGVTERGFTGLQVGFRSPLYWPIKDHIDTASGPSPTATLPLEVFARLRPGVSMAEAIRSYQCRRPGRRHCCSSRLDSCVAQKDEHERVAFDYRRRN